MMPSFWKDLPHACHEKRNRAAELAEERRVYLLVDVRDRRQCRLTGVKHDLEHHHIVFRSQGGKTTTENVLLLTKIAHKLIQTRHAWIDGADANDPALTFSMPERIARQLFGGTVPAHVRLTARD